MIGEVLLFLLSAVQLHLACDDIFTLPYGKLTSPNYPKNYPSDSNCTTRVTMPEGSQMVITFQEFNTEGCKYDFLQIFPVVGGDSNGVIKLCGNQLPSQLITWNNNVTFHFHSDQSTELTGFHLEWKVLDRITYQSQPTSWLEASRSCSLAGATLVNLDDAIRQQIKNTTLTSIQSIEAWTGSYFTPWVWYKGCLKPSSTWSHINVTRFKQNGWAVCVGHCVKYNYFALQGDMCSCLDGFDGEFVDPQIYCQTTCPGVRDEACGGEGTYTVYMNDICYNGSTSWQGTVSQATSGDLCKPWADYNTSSLHYPHGFADGSKQNASNYCRDPIRHGRLWCITDTIDSHTQECDVPACAVEDVSTDAPSRCVEFTYGDAQVTTRQVSCFKKNSYLQVRTEQIQGGHLLTPVTSNVSYQWNTAWKSFTSAILNTGSNAGKKGGPYWRGFTRSIVHWPLQDYTKTPTDCIKMVATGGSFDEIGSVCSAKLPYFCQQAIITCGETLTSENGTFRSPGYPTSYTAFLNCKWQIAADSDYYITLTLEFDLEESHACQNDYIKVHDGNDTTSQIIGIWCGNNVQTIKSTGSQLMILFRSDKTVNDKGFTAQWTTVLRPVFEPDNEKTTTVNDVPTKTTEHTKPSSGFTKTEPVWMLATTLVALVVLVSK